ncbi:elongation factor P maturation arginine rhamnosyltransferase EarP [Cupriavidus sp. SZY C1]|uniref:elongation factor P maturation arginine rhamnosyltransferase EarP n=1 Tax=Cupriavidus sp. SZY C1 TaxID=3055037 RepID=UPI0028BC36E3|nr:elongation factor P maturation arginine rhamnosyltransferase EarP [Cupriavidus sp. SZY C1]MDT6959996.1 elongation factor P maturation arginine rhamnosyltransferase EarP [Cupriavidus sp. SZY C1]
MLIRSWDIFCTVIDNFGDIGVCWRLARQLAQEHDHAVRLWVDDLGSFAKLAPEIDSKAVQQRLAGVDVHRWDARPDAPFAAPAPHDAVIEAFACHLPEPFLAAMAAAPRKPVWLNLEYLSAEDWVSEHHAMASPHPRLPLTKYFFFPGFARGTGGLLRESMIGASRDAFRTSPAAQATLWHRLGVRPTPGTLRISFFAYANPAAPALLDQWRDGPTPIECFVPQGLAATQVAEWLGAPLTPGTTHHRGSLTIHGIPFVRQEHYDELLWACDVNFVRGEDSCVRAHWAGRPMVWHIYPQDDHAHHVKLDAWLTRFARAGVAPEASAALTALSHAWNGYGTRPDWAGFEAQLPALTAGVERWQRQLQHLGDLAANLVDFSENRVK